MKPEQFIREYGVEKAREVVEGAPDWAKGYYEPTGQYQDQEWSDEMSVGIEDLKRLVESLDQVDAFDYGLAEAKDLLSNMKRSKDKYTIDFEVPAFEQVILDYESIYGGE